jgi:hypothetical protein
MDYIANDLNKGHWDSIFRALSFFSAWVKKEEAVRNGAPKEPREHVPLLS